MCVCVVCVCVYEWLLLLLLMMMTSITVAILEGIALSRARPATTPLAPRRVLVVREAAPVALVTVAWGWGDVSEVVGRGEI